MKLLKNLKMLGKNYWIFLLKNYIARIKKIQFMKM